jgi:type IV secretory pathway TraG/TraD family ATPase VirD4
MSSSMPEAGSVPDPFAAIGAIGHWLLAAALGCLLGLAIGAVAARSMRTRHLHWSWALVAAAPVLLMRSALGGASLPCVVAALAAARTGRRWHHEDLEAGADLRELAMSRRSPLDALEELTRRIGSVPPEGERDAGCERGALELGRDERGRTVTAEVSGGRHALVVGATGSGKTVTQTTIAVHEIAAGSAAVIIDPKGDASMLASVCRAAGDAGRRFVHWHPDGSTVYNPYARGTETEIADKVLAGETFTEPHYLRQAQRYVGHVVRALRAAGAQVSLAAIVEQLDPERLELLARELPEEAGAATHGYLDALTSRQRRELAGVRDRLAILAESDVGPLLDPATSGATRFELLQAIRAGATVYFSLESDRRPLLAQMLGAAIVQDLLTAVASLQGNPRPALIVIDEFSAVAARQVIRLFGRARSAGFSLLLGTQELADLRLSGEGQLLEPVVGNLSLLIAHRQVVPTSAEFVSALAGTRGAWRVTRSSDGRSSRTRIREKSLSPDRIMALPTGRAVVIALGDGTGGRIAEIRRTHLASAGEVPR